MQIIFLRIDNLFAKVRYMNWKTVITELLARGETLTSIATYVGGITPASIGALMRNPGQQPAWITGEKLLAMHKRLLRKYPRIDTTA